MFLTALILTVLLLAIPLRMLWLTRLAAVPGLYTSSGVWVVRRSVSRQMAKTARGPPRWK